MKKVLIVALFLCILPLQNVSATIIDGADVNGYGTFIDASGRTWIDMDSFYNKSASYMISAVQNAGFEFATKQEVHDLLDPLTLDPSAANDPWDQTYAPFMGQSSTSRQLIWGIYDEGPKYVNPYGAAHAFDTSTEWTFQDGASRDAAVTSEMSIWAYTDAFSSPVPEPTTMLLFGIGLLGLAGVNRTRKQ
jgi:hypothetical protein